MFSRTTWDSLYFDDNHFTYSRLTNFAFHFVGIATEFTLILFEPLISSYHVHYK